MLSKVHNDNIYPYREKFRDDWIEIPAKGFVEMDQDEALYFISAFSPVVRDGQNVPDPKFFKMLRIEDPPKAEAPSLMNHATGVQASSIEELNRVLDKFADRLVKDEDVEKYAKKRDKDLKKENEELKAKLRKREQELFGKSSEKNNKTQDTNSQSEKEKSKPLNTSLAPVSLHSDEKISEDSGDSALLKSTVSQNDFVAKSKAGSGDKKIFPG